MKKRRRPRATDNPEEGLKGPRLQRTRRCWQAAPTVRGAQTKSTPRTAGHTAAGQTALRARSLSNRFLTEKAAPPPTVVLTCAANAHTGCTAEKNIKYLMSLVRS